MGLILRLTHGWGTNSTEWFYTKEALARRFRLIVWDLPGLGESKPRADGNYSLEKLAEDLEAVAALAGHSIGGMITLTLCRLLGDRLRSKVAGIVLIHTTYTNPVHTTTLSGLMRALQTPVLTLLCYLMIGLAPLFWLTNWLSYLNGSMHLSTWWSGFVAPTREKLEFATGYSARAWPDVVARGMPGMFRFDATPKLNVPALVVAESRDPALPPDRSSEVLRERLPEAEYVVLEPAKHMGLVQEHEAFNGALEAFAPKCGASSAGLGS